MPSICQVVIAAVAAMACATGASARPLQAVHPVRDVFAGEIGTSANGDIGEMIMHEPSDAADVTGRRLLRWKLVSKKRTSSG
jgi:hypothetical protein